MERSKENGKGGYINHLFTFAISFERVDEEELDLEGLKELKL